MPYVVNDEEPVVEEEIEEEVQQENLIGSDEGLKPGEAAKMLDSVNQYRAAAGVPALAWNGYLEVQAQTLATWYATDVDNGIWEAISLPMIGRQCNGAKTASKAVFDWMEGNAYVPSEAAKLLSPDFTSMGGALYYLPSGGYKYYWIICFG